MEHARLLDALTGCDLAFGPNDLRRCVWCGRALLPNQSDYCSPTCRTEWRANHHYDTARLAALRRDHYRCSICAGEDVQVHHRAPIEPGTYGIDDCRHHLDGLLVLCRAHHDQLHRALRSDRPYQLTLVA